MTDDYRELPGNAHDDDADRLVKRREASYDGGAGVEVAEATAEATAKRQRCVLKGLYFVQTGAAAGLVKFLPVYLESMVGLSPTQIGAMLVMGQVTNFCGGLFWGRAADVTGRYKLTMVVTNVFATIFAVGLAAPWVRNGHGLSGVLVLTFILQAFFGSCWGTLVDAVAVIGTGAGSGSGGYGRLRLWAAVGWGSCAVVSGWLIDAAGIGSIFVSFGAGMGVSSLLVLLFFSDPKRKGGDDESRQISTKAEDRRSGGGGGEEDHETAVAEEEEVIEEERKIIEDKERGGGGEGSSAELGSILLRAEVVLLLLNLFLQGTLVAFVESFLYVYLDEVYACPGFFLGLCTFVAAVFELPVFYYAEAIIARVGVKGILTFAQFLYATRVWCYTVIPKSDVNVCSLVGGSCPVKGYWFFLLLEPSHAFVFAAMWSAAVEYSRVLAPERHQGIMQALTRGVYYFIGNGCGSVLGGVLIDSRSDRADGYHFMYHFGAIAMVGWSFTWHALMKIANKAGCESSISGNGDQSSKGDPPTVNAVLSSSNNISASPLIDPEDRHYGDGYGDGDD